MKSEGMDSRIITAILAERKYQDQKMVLHDWQKEKSVVEMSVIMQSELEEAITGWIKGGVGRQSAEHELLQTIAVGIAFLEQIAVHAPSLLGELQQISSGVDWGMVPLPKIPANMCFWSGRFKFSGANCVLVRDVVEWYYRRGWQLRGNQLSDEDYEALDEEKRRVYDGDQKRLLRALRIMDALELWDPVRDKRLADAEKEVKGGD